MNIETANHLGDVADALYGISGLVEPDPTVGELVARAVAVQPTGQRSTRVQVRALTEAAGGAAGRPLVGPGQPTLADYRRPVLLRDLVPAVKATTFSVPFVREMSPVADEGGVSGVPELAVKPDGGDRIRFEPINVVPGTLAVNITASRQLLDDAPAFGAYLDARLPYALRVDETVAALYANGELVNAGITGLAHTPGVAQVTGATGLVAAIAKAAATIGSRGGNADAVFCSPVDFWPALQAAPAFFDALPLAVTPLFDVQPGTAFVGAFSTGCVLVDRQEAVVEVFPQHSDLAIRNEMLVQAEERVGFAVTAPWSFAMLTGL